LTSSSPLKFNKDYSGFYATLRERADQYFSSNNISRHADGLMIAKTVLFVGGTFSLYLLLLFGGFAPLTMLGMAIVMGMFSAFIGFNVCHDALHGSYSSNGAVNTAVGSIFHLIGANTYNWKISHNVVHHTYTNIHDHDDDLVVAPGLVSVCPQDQPLAIQRYQHFYAFLLYGFASLSWIFVKDYQKFFQDSIGSYDTRKHPRIEYFKLFFFKVLYYGLVIVLPLLLIDQITWWQFIIGFVAMQMAKGFVLGLVFQLAHIVEDLEFPEAHTSGCMEDAWAVHQLRTTANFGRKSFLTTFFCGGLNMQVEHHLFPKVCHTHYMALSNIVQQTAQEFGVPYYENESFGTALASHYRLLRRFGRDALRERKLKLKQMATA
jgi:linoleoyl-CoA desaturase